MAEEQIQFLENEKPENPVGGSAENELAEPTLESQPEQIREKVGEKYSQILSQVKTAQAPVDDAGIASDADAVSEEEDTKAVVARLVTLAETKGVAHAVAVARKMQDLYLLDTMHDTLADELYEAFREKGLIGGE